MYPLQIQCQVWMSHWMRKTFIQNSLFWVSMVIFCGQSIEWDVYGPTKKVVHTDGHFKFNVKFKCHWMRQTFTESSVLKISKVNFDMVVSNLRSYKSMVVKMCPRWWPFHLQFQIQMSPNEAKNTKSRLFQMSVLDIEVSALESYMSMVWCPQRLPFQIQF